MDHRELKKLVQLMNDNELVELEIEEEGHRVSLRKAGAVAPVPTAPAFLPAPVEPVVVSAVPVEDLPNGPPPGTRHIVSPMVGTFYRRPSPESDPYVEKGFTIEEETVVCIVEAMKVNNELKAEMDGEVLEILVEDGNPVEFDQPLFLVKVG